MPMSVVCLQNLSPNRTDENAIIIIIGVDHRGSMPGTEEFLGKDSKKFLLSRSFWLHGC